MKSLEIIRRILTKYACPARFGGILLLGRVPLQIMWMEGPHIVTLGLWENWEVMKFPPEAKPGGTDFDCEKRAPAT